MYVGNIKVSTALLMVPCLLDLVILFWYQQAIIKQQVRVKQERDKQVKDKHAWCKKQMSNITNWATNEWATQKR